MGLRAVQGPVAGTWVPTVTPAAGAITSYTVTYAKYTLFGKKCHAEFRIVLTNHGTGSGGLSVTLPFTVDSNRYMGTGRETVNTGVLLGVQALGAGTACTVIRYDNTTIIATNADITASVEYDVA